MGSFAATGCRGTGTVDVGAEPGRAPAARPVSSLDAQGLLDLLAAKQAAGRPVVVHFWATWCPPCVEELPRFLAASEGWAGRADVLLLALDEPAQQAEVARRTGARAGRYLLDVPDAEAITSKFSKEWSGSLPATFVLDAGGTVTYRAIGPFDAGDVEAALKE